MFLRFFLLMTLIPILEIYFLLRLSDFIGGTETFMVIVATGVIGAWLLKSQGGSIIRQVQNSASQNQIPSDALARGFFTFIGGVLLLTPGLITDALGMSLIFPPTQLLWKRYFLKQWERGVERGSVRIFNMSSGFRRPDDGFVDPFQQNQSQKKFDAEVIDVNPIKATTVDKKDED